MRSDQRWLRHTIHIIMHSYTACAASLADRARNVSLRNNSRVEICGCVYKRRVEIKREEFNKPFSHHLHLLFGKGFCKVHDEPFESGLNCFHAVFIIFHPGLSFQPGLSILVEIQPGLSCKRVIAFMCVSG